VLAHARTAAAAEDPTEREVDLLSRASGLPLRSFREEHLHRQIARAVEREGAADGAELATLIGNSHESRRRFRRSVAVSVSNHFRDPKQFELIKREVLPALVEHQGTIRIWSAGCADGSELYDIGGMLEAAGALDRTYLLGSDLLEENLRKAAAMESKEASPTIRLRVRWERRDVVNEPAPAGAWRLILCRNLAIYLRPAVRDSLHAMLAAALTPGGYLVLGRSERIADPDSLGLHPAGPNLYRRPA
jgi:chemotaxis protein methyltransferase CheR